MDCLYEFFSFYDLIRWLHDYGYGLASRKKEIYEDISLSYLNIQEYSTYVLNTSKYYRFLPEEFHGGPTNLS